MISIIKKTETLFKTIYITKMSFYAVAKGREIGIFRTWNECEKQVSKFSDAKFKKFKTQIEAEKYLKENGSKKSDKNYSSTLVPSEITENEVCRFHKTASYIKRQTKKLAKQKEFSDLSNCNNEKDEVLANQNIKNKVVDLDSDEHVLSFHSHNDNDNQNNSSNNNQFDDDDEDDNLLATVAERIEKTEKLSRRRKFDCNLEEKPNKKFKYESIVYETIGTKKFGDYEFPIDIDGYVIVYTDGGCENNGRKNAAAGFGVYFDDNHPLNASEPVKGRATNNCGEIQAAIHALNIIKNNGINKVIINTDSQFLINSATKWIWSWHKNNWKLKSGEPVKNTEEFRELYPFLKDKNIKIKWNYTRGHNGIKGNEEADALATKGIESYKKSHNIK